MNKGDVCYINNTFRPHHCYYIAFGNQNLSTIWCDGNKENKILSLYKEWINLSSKWKLILSWQKLSKKELYFGMILRSSISNRSVLSINPWFLSTKLKALCPCKTLGRELLKRKKDVRAIEHCFTRKWDYRKCCWSWTFLVIVIIRVSKLRRNYDSALLQGENEMENTRYLPQVKDSNTESM